MKTRVIQEDSESIETGTPVPAAGERGRPLPQRRPPLSGQRVAVLVVAGFAALISVLALVGGGALLWLDGAKTDASGYYTSTAHQYSTEGRAMVTNGFNFDAGDASFLLGSDRLAELRLTSTSNDPDKQLFVGIARQQDVADYLRDVEFAAVGDIDLDPFTVSYTNQPGSAVPTPPADAGIWAASATGEDTEILQWPTQDGDWSIVVMNADGSPNVDADVAVAAKAPFIFDVGLGLAIGGFVLALTAATVLILTIRSRPTAAAAATPLTDVL